MDYQVTIQSNGQPVMTLADILPAAGPLRMLVVGKTPLPASVELGHYLQSRQGRLFWRRLEDYEILRCPQGAHPDEMLLACGLGITDIVKVPHELGIEPTADEYRAGWEHVEELIQRFRPRIVTFVYKGSLDRVLKLNYGWQHSSVYGFNQDLTRTFGRRVFAFPLPGTPCTLRESQRAMEELSQALAVL
jgi:TDG/mug DNA glycosylase family protein